MAGYIESPAQVVARRARQRAQKAAQRAAPGYVAPQRDWPPRWKPGTSVVDPEDFAEPTADVRCAA